MSKKNSILGAWGGKYTSAQLSVVLREHRGEFLDLCRRVTCNEIGANKLVNAVEEYLNQKRPISLAGRISLSSSENIAKPTLFPEMLTSDEDFHTTDISRVDEEVNLIQLLAEVHLAIVSRDTGS